MSERKVYHMTQVQYDALLEASQPTPAMYLSGGQPMFDSQQERANAAWKKLGDEMGFEYMSVRPGDGKLMFTAEPKEKTNV